MVLPRTRRMVFAGSVVAITATGSWVGAGLKTNQQQRQEGQKRREATPAEKIAQLEDFKAGLVAKRTMLEIKLEELEERARRVGSGEGWGGLGSMGKWERRK